MRTIHTKRAQQRKRAITFVRVAGVDVGLHPAAVGQLVCVPHETDTCVVVFGEDERGNNIVRFVDREYIRRVPDDRVVEVVVPQLRWRLRAAEVVALPLSRGRDIPEDPCAPSGGCAS